MFYPAYIHSDPDGSASGFFPDVPCRYFAGDTLDYAFEDARSALVAHFETLCEMNEELPLPALWKHIWSSVRRTLLAGNGCWWISI